jgi:hypothetical protein
MTNKIADTWFSRFIRLRYSDDSGYCKCITCDTILFWKNMDCGHWVKRQHAGARFNEKNCHAQCRKCNWLKQGNDEVYSKVIVEKYGQQTYDLLKSCERSSTKYTGLELKIIANEYKKKTMDLLQLKGLTL